MADGRLANGAEPEFRYKDIESNLKKLLDEFGYGRAKPRPEHPFVYLGSKPELWQVTDKDGQDIFKMSGPIDPSRSTPARETVSFLREQANGRVSNEFAAALKDPILRDEIVRFLLNAEFPESTHEDVLNSVGLCLTENKTVGRDPAFREKVLLAYENKCSFCDFSAYLRGRSVGVDAAHLRMHAKQGPSRIENGIALCTFHHRLFDSGAIGLGVTDGKREILVSQHLNVFDEPSSPPLLALSREPMRPPLRGYSPPAKEHIDWHYENLFKQPARQ